MKQKHLLMIVPFFPPLSGGGVFRPLSYVKYLGRHGWRTTVISPAAASYWVRDDSLVNEIPADCRVIRTPSLSGQAVLAALRGKPTGRQPAQVRSSRGFGLMRKLGNGLLFPDTYIGWYPFAMKAAREVLRNDPAAAIFSTSPPETSHVIGRRLHRLSGLPWLADFRDPWINLYRFKPPTRWHRRRHERLMDRICREAAVVVASRWNLELLSSRNPGLRIRHISNGFDAPKLEGLFELGPESAPFQILHAGMLSENRSAVPFLNGLRRFIDATPASRENCRVVFLGPREDQNETAARDLGLEEVVEFRNSVTHRETLRAERTSHILLLINPYREIVLGKLYEYIGVRRPVLGLLPPGEGTELIASLGRGESAPPDRPDQIADKLAVLYQKYVEGSLEDSYNLEPMNQYARENLAGDLAAFLDELITERNG